MVIAYFLTFYLHFYKVGYLQLSNLKAQLQLSRFGLCSHQDLDLLLLGKGNPEDDAWPVIEQPQGD